MDLDPYLIDEIKHGKVALLFGSGALYGAKFPDGKGLILGDDLKLEICEQFLGGEYREETLQFVSELAINKCGLFKLQDFIAEKFDGVEPGEFHKKIAQFKWRALFSTNYDLLIEDSYRLATDSLQKCRSIVSNNDPLDEASRTDEFVPLVKLHGCVTRRRDMAIPLILTIDQYNDCLANRDRLFKFLYQVAYENTMVFVGHSLKDPNIRHVISLIDKEVKEGRPRYYLIKPGARQPEIELWQSRRITVLDCGLEDFINAIESSVSTKERRLSLALPPRSHPIQSKFTRNVEPNAELISFLSNDVDYVAGSNINQEGDVRAFYSGAGQEWFPVTNCLDVRRTLGKKIYSEVIRVAESERESGVEFYVVKGEAGSGKSVLLRRLCHDSALEAGLLCLYARPLANITFEKLEFIYQLTKERIFLFWDNTAANVVPMAKILRAARKSEILLTIITCERYTEWNGKCEEVLDSYLTRNYLLPYLGPMEIEELVGLLDRHNCLGPALEPLTHQERLGKFEQSYGRQLLVALHEVTMGASFEDIIQNEYDALQPDQAKLLYRTVCVLNRLRIPVRAGLISRVFGITFEKFQKDFFRPLQKVVLTYGSTDTDVHYMARHSEIAEIVFQRCFDTDIDRYHEYVRLIEALNISFESDRRSYRQLIKARNLVDIFSDYQDVRRIYEKALEEIGRDSYLLQQMANFERIRDSGNLSEAVSLLKEAAHAAPHDQSILHSQALVWRKRAELAEEIAVREQFRREARGILNSLASSGGHTPHIDSGLIEIALDNLSDILTDSDLPEKTIDEAIRDIEKVVSESQKRFPTEDYLLSLEARFAAMLRDEPRATRALQAAFSKDSRDPFIAIRLSRIHLDNKDYQQAELVLKTSLDQRRGDKRLNFAYGELLRKTVSGSSDRKAYYYQRAFAPGDQNYQAQFWFARFALESTDTKLLEKSISAFSSLRRARVSHEMRIKVRDIFGEYENPKRIRGSLVRKAATYALFRIAELPLNVFLHENNVVDDVWELLEMGEQATFEVGYSYSGLVCVNLELV
ncbi:MAG: hypothetical protein CME43_10590 [Haliea sp.]|uniref:P-loop NTPase n=1 Tax=Haliea sp. TaxID=1932666 RepID=UPI000C60AC78|nr:SIR2 family protein [Haliea sp.]MBM69913.1 hypothetical protein [Haliea sp.]|tara:strand:+ start:1461 stop:4577 length:3117 start_codon:yes stop_codon:yes gene_type:complete